MRLVVSFAVLLVLGGAAPQEPLPTFQTSVDGVRVDVRVTHRGRAVTRLTPNDFEVLDNGVPQIVESVSAEHLPLNVLLVFDVSGSMAGDPLRHLAEAAQVLLGGLGDADRAALITFSHEIHLAAGLTADVRQVAARLTHVRAAGSTSLFDAVYAGLRFSDTDPDRWVMVVFSDGLDNTSWLSAPDVLARARVSDVVVYGVALPADDDGPTGLTMQDPGAPRIFARGAPRASRTGRAEPAEAAFLGGLARQTGGVLLIAASSRRLPAVFRQILDELKTRYVLTYSPRGVDPGGWHDLEVRLKGRPGDVTARTGYYATR
jgi:Ca-activated chloride channel homolog